MKFIILITVFAAAFAADDCDFDETTAEIFVQANSWSGTNDDDVSSVECPVKYDLVGCECVSQVGRDDCDGTIIRDGAPNSFCDAYNSYGGQGVKARARCQRIHVVCSTDPKRAQPIIGCPRPYKTSGCTMHSFIQHNQWWTQDVHPRSARGTGGYCPAAQLPRDVVILLDSSGSMSTSGWASAVNFAHRMIDALTLGPNDDQVGIVQFRSSVQATIDMNAYTDATALKNAISALNYYGGGTSIGLALSAAHADITANGRLLSRKIVLALTDGSSWDDPEPPAQALHNDGVTVVSIGIGNYLDLTQLNDMATDANHVLLVTSASDIEEDAFIQQVLVTTGSCMGQCYTTPGCDECTVQASCIRTAQLLPGQA